jgi:anaerobic selenocysteine-containing dehydrogenase
MLDEQGGIQWPFTEGINRSEQNLDQNKNETSFSKERRLFEDGKFFTEDGRARFLFDLPREMPEKPDDKYPFLLLTGRGTSLQWHTNTRTEKSDVLRKLYPNQCYVEINPKDAKRLGIQVNDVVSIGSRRAEITATAFVTPTVQPGQVFIPMHYPEGQ